MDEENTLLDPAYVVVGGGAHRRRLLHPPPRAPLPRRSTAGGNVLMPGLVNAHTHIPMTLMRGYAGGRDLHTWLNDWIFPAEAKLDDRAVRAGADLALAELIAGGSPPLPTCTCTPPPSPRRCWRRGSPPTSPAAGSTSAPRGLQPRRLPGL